MSLGLLDGKRDSFLHQFAQFVQPQTCDECTKSNAKLPISEAVDLQIHFSARLLHTRLSSDPRLKCGLFKKFRLDTRTGQWHKKSSDSLSIQEARVSAHEQKFLAAWVELAVAIVERKHDFGFFESINWREIQQGLKVLGWGDSADECPYSESLISLIQEEVKRRHDAASTATEHMGTDCQPNVAIASKLSSMPLAARVRVRPRFAIQQENGSISKAGTLERTITRQLI